MERVIYVDPDELEAWARSTPQDRLRQANAAFRLFHSLHQPFAKPFVRGFDSLEAFFTYEKEHDLYR